MKLLYGDELDKELAKRKVAKQIRLDKKLTLREAAKTNTMGLTLSEYCDWENGYDVSPHEKRELLLGCIHPPFIVMNKCIKCGHIENIGLEDEVPKEILEEAFQNSQRKIQSQTRSILDDI